MFAFKKSTFVIGAAVVTIAIAIFLLLSVINPKTPNWVTAEVERGVVSEIVSVSGFVEAENTAELAFPTSGVVTEVYAYEGMEAKEGEVLATLGSAELIARRNEAQAAVRVAEARYDKLIAGKDKEERAVAETVKENAQLLLERTKAQEEEKVATAKRALLSNDLEALSLDPKESATQPSVTGTYACEEEGSYTLEVYSSNAYSGYSYRYSGLEEGNGSVSTDQPSALGSCGLYLQFTEGDTYANSQWEISVPNKRSSTYLTYANAYELALQTQVTTVAEAEDAFRLASLETDDILADPRSEEIRESIAAIDQALSARAAIDALLSDRSVVAPFDGTVTNVDIVKGETAFADPVVTMLASDAFKLTVRIPEIDITKLKNDQRATAVFDAAPNEVLHGHISYISPLAVVIDGVAYFEATLALDTKPTWLRSGLNADVDITITEKENVLRIPRRFLIDNNDGTYSVRTPKGSSFATTTVRLEFEGNDGFIEVIGLNEGDIVIAP